MRIGDGSQLDLNGQTLYYRLADIQPNATILLNGGLLIELAAAGEAGDYDNSNFVAQSDLDLVLLNWGDDVSVTGVPDGWVNQQPTGLIGQGALDNVSLHWGNGTPPLGAVPEPATAILMLLPLLVARRMMNGPFGAGIATRRDRSPVVTKLSILHR